MGIIIQQGVNTFLEIQQHAHAPVPHLRHFALEDNLRKRDMNAVLDLLIGYLLSLFLIFLF